MPRSRIVFASVVEAVVVSACDDGSDAPIMPPYCAVKDGNYVTEDGMPLILGVLDETATAMLYYEGHWYDGPAVDDTFTVTSGLDPGAVITGTILGPDETFLEYTSPAYSQNMTATFVCENSGPVELPTDIRIDITIGASTGYVVLQDWDGLALCGGRIYSHCGVNPEPLPMYMVYDYVREPYLVLRAAPAVGQTWVGEFDCDTMRGWTASSEVVSTTASITVRGTLYAGCVRVQTVITGSGQNRTTGDPATAAQNEFARGTRNMYFCPGVGLVKVDHLHEDGTTTLVELDSSTVGSSSSLFPAASGDTWTYVWTNGYQAGPVTETCSIP
ncbi:MAG: hypothetical protein ACYTKD_04485 [Planctomycetota bacterium]|jgi:hypothetical protein